MASIDALCGKKARYLTLGCKLNFAETASFARQLAAHGVVEAAPGERADLCLINTCAVTEVAVAKCRQVIHRLVRQNAGALVVVTGCYAQLAAESIAQIAGVHLVLGSNEKAQLVDHLLALAAANESESVYKTTPPRGITSFAPACSRGNRTRYFLKVQDGCSYYCTYCTIPLARGHSRSPSIATLVSLAQAAADEGAREIVLTGVNIGDFGRPRGERFLSLLRALDAVDGITRYRISSIEPDLLDDEVITFCAQESTKFMPHFHIPLQSGADGVLRLMRRRYDTRLFAAKIALIRALLPAAFIGVDIMVGCRGETPALFDESYAFVRGLPLSKLHVFPYSERPNTAALALTPIVAEREKRRRAALLRALSAEKQRAFYEAFIGSVRPVLFERATRGRSMQGFTDNYIRVELGAAPRAELDNTICRVRLTGWNAAGTALVGVLDE